MPFHTILYYTILLYISPLRCKDRRSWSTSFSLLLTGGPFSYFSSTSSFSFRGKHGRLGKVPFLGSVLLSRWVFMLYIVSIC